MAVSSGDDTVVTIASIKEVVDMPEDEIISSNRSFEEPIADTSSADMRGNELISESSPVDTDTSYSKDLDTRNCAASGDVIDPFTSTTTEGGSNEPANAGIVSEVLNKHSCICNHFEKGCIGEEFRLSYIRIDMGAYRNGIGTASCA